jgi:Uma2 family endonuclease
MNIATGVSLEEYLNTSYEPDCDYVDGVLEDRNVGKRPHSLTQMQAILVLNPIVRPKGLAALPEQRLQVSKTKVRIPDVCIIPIQGQDVEQSPPLLCIEIRSPEDSLKRLMNVVADYLAFGVPVIWVIDPVERAAFVVTQENPGWTSVEELTWEGVVIPLSEILTPEVEQ